MAHFFNKKQREREIKDAKIRTKRDLAFTQDFGGRGYS